MRCYICDVRLTPDEINFNKLHDRYDPCSNCLELSNETDKKSDSDVSEFLRTSTTEDAKVDE